jgi:DNA-binding XRE family transcriptional regulator
MSVKKRIGKLVQSKQEELQLLKALPSIHERKLLRLGAGVTQAEAAAALGVSRVLYLNWEHGSNPSKRYLRDYLDLLIGFEAIAAKAKKGNTK